MNRDHIFQQIRNKGSFLCIGLDTDPGKIPRHLLSEEDPVFAFNKAIIDATHDLAVAYKPNTAFYEALGSAGWKSLERTVAYIRMNYPGIFIIADAKRGDIGNTSARYAEAFLSTMDCDAVTVAPYMGEDSVSPFFGKDGKWVILLALTSNSGSTDFQMSETEGRPLFERVISRSQAWGSPDSLMFVVGATKAEHFLRIREIAPEHFLLVPGVGAQGGDLATVARYGLNEKGGLLVNSSRGIIYAGKGNDFAEDARSAAKEVQQEMEALLKEKGLLSA